MTPAQAAINTRALMAAAAKLERTGWEGDAFRFCEGLVLSVLADGYRRIEPVPPLAGSTSTPQARIAALKAAEAAVRRSKDRRKKPATPEETS